MTETKSFAEMKRLSKSKTQVCEQYIAESLKRGHMVRHTYIDHIDSLDFSKGYINDNWDGINHFRLSCLALMAVMNDRERQEFMIQHDLEPGQFHQLLPEY